jgi:hypothetical protein
MGLKFRSVRRVVTWRGYVRFRPPDCPGSPWEHRQVMARYLGRPLLPEEVVHHRDLCRSNNELSNLLLIPTQDLHLALHREIEAGNRRIVAAYETWLLETMEAIRRRGGGRR